MILIESMLLLRGNALSVPLLMNGTQVNPNADSVATRLIRKTINLAMARDRKSLLIVCLVLFSLSVLRYWVRYDPTASVPDEPESMRVAHNLYDAGAFANPFAALDTGPSAHLCPVFPVFVAFLMKLFGDGSAGQYSIQMAALLILSFQLSLFPVFSRNLGMGATNGAIAALVWIVAKLRLVYGWECLYASVLLAAACCGYRRYVDQQSWGWAWFLGIVMGFLILTCETAAAIYLVWLTWEIWHRKMTFFKTTFLPLVLAPVLIIMPWTIRNYLALHSFTPLRDDLGLELYVSNNDYARFGIIANIQSGCFARFHPNKNLAEASMVKALGEVQYNKLRLHGAVQWICTHPVRFAGLTLERFIAFWMPTETFNAHYASGRRLERVVIYLMTLLSLPGMLMLYRRDSKSVMILLSCLVAFPLVYYIIQFEYRYRYPIMWITFLLGAMPLTLCARKFLERYLEQPFRINVGQ